MYNSFMCVHLVTPKVKFARALYDEYSSLSKSIIYDETVSADFLFENTDGRLCFDNLSSTPKSAQLYF